MITDELKKEAEEYAEGMAKYYASTHEDCIPSQFEKYLRNAYISSAEPREKRIAELEKQLDIVRNERNLFQERCEDILENYYCDHPCKCAELEKENAELQHKIDILQGYLDRDVEYQELQKENAELKEQNETKDIQIKELQEQKCYWKESSFDWRHKFFKKDEVKRLVKKDKQLTKAKNLLQKVADVCGYPNYDIPVELYANIADFLKDSEVEK